MFHSYKQKAERDKKSETLKLSTQCSSCDEARLWVLQGFVSSIHGLAVQLNKTNASLFEQKNHQ